MRTIHRDIVGIFILSGDNKILLGRSTSDGVYKDQWVVPGGGIEEGETLLEGGLREVREEVGVDLSSFTITPYDEVHEGESEKTLKDTGERVLVKMKFHDFIARTDKPASEIDFAADDDIDEAAWIDLSSIEQESVSPPTLKIIRRIT